MPRDKYPCGVCDKQVGAGGVYCNCCEKWIHKKCADVSYKAYNQDTYKCARCLLPVQLKETELQYVGPTTFESPMDPIYKQYAAECRSAKRKYSSIY